MEEFEIIYKFRSGRYKGLYVHRCKDKEYLQSLLKLNISTHLYRAVKQRIKLMLITST